MPSHIRITTLNPPLIRYRRIACIGWFAKHAHPRYYNNNELIKILILGILLNPLL